MTTASTSEPIKEKKKPKWALIVALVLFLLGVAGCGGGLVVGIGTLSSLADDVAHTTPMGESTTFEATGGGKAGVLLTNTAVCEGSSEDGESIRFDRFSGNTTVNTGDEQFNDVLTFDTVEGRSYTLTCGAPGTGDYTVLQLPSILASTAGIALLGGGIIAGGVFILLSIILLIVGLVQRSSWKKKQNQGFATPTGYGAPTQQVPPTPGQGGGSPWNVPPAPGQNAPGQGAPGGWGAPPADPPQGPPPMPPQPQGPPPMPPQPQGPPPQPPVQPQQAPPSQSPPPPPPPPPSGEQPPPPPPLR